MKKTSLKISALFILLLALFSNSVTGQTRDSKGTNFWLTFNENLSTPTITLFITSEVNTSGLVEIPGLSFSVPFTVTANTVTPVLLPNSVSMHTNDVVDNKGIHVTSLAEVTVYGLNYAPFTTDAYLGLPVDALGTDYIIMSYTGAGYSYLGIVGTVNGTTVTITPSVAAAGHLAGVPFNITINQGETYELKTGSDLTGSLVTSTNPIGVTGGNSCANIPPGYSYCDHIDEMLTSTDTWGQSFATVPLRDRTNGDTWRFLASQNSTVVTINGVAQPAINKGQYIETILTAKSLVQSNKPILAAQFSNGSTYSSNPGDPFMMLVPPLEQFLAHYTVTTVSGYVSHYVNIVAPSSVAGTLTMDGAPVASSEFSPIGASGFSGAQLIVPPGSHTFNATLPFGLFMYGFNMDDSYGYPGGQSFSPIATVNNINLLPASGTAAINNEQCFDATVKDQLSNPLEGIRVDFGVKGVNSSSSGFAFTDSTGVAHFCYTGLVAGLDSIIASVGSLADTSTFMWTGGTGICDITIIAKKFYDLNTDSLDNDGKGVQGWTFVLTGIDSSGAAVGPIVQATDSSGITEFTGLINGTYTIAEALPPHWFNTTVTSKTVTITNCTNPDTLRFGNVCIGGGTGAGGLGYWANKNGQSHITASYLCTLNSLCLRNAAGADFNPVSGCPSPTLTQVAAGKLSVKNWLLDAFATNMSYMLSAQLTAMELNILDGRVSASRLVYAPHTSSANTAGFASLSSLITEGNTILCDNAVIGSKDILRRRAEAVKDALDAANNNLNYVQLEPCPVNAVVSSKPIKNYEMEPINSVSLMVAPNPSHSYFTLHLAGCKPGITMQIRVTDIMGRLIEEKSNLTNGILKIGDNYRPGYYFVELTNGQERQIKKIIKIN